MDESDTPRTDAVIIPGEHDDLGAFEAVPVAFARGLEREVCALRHRVIEAAYRPGPMCRDCGDHDGTCPRDGTKCDPFEAALDRLRSAVPSQFTEEKS